MAKSSAMLTIAAERAGVISTDRAQGQSPRIVSILGASHEQPPMSRSGPPRSLSCVDRSLLVGQ